MMTKISDTARVILSRASRHPDALAEPPRNLPTAARDAVVRSMLKHGLLAEVPAPREHLAPAWREGDDGAPVALRITAAGLRAIGVEPEVAQLEPQAGDGAQPREVERGMPTPGQGVSQAPTEPNAPPLWRNGTRSPCVGRGGGARGNAPRQCGP